MTVRIAVAVALILELLPSFFVVLGIGCMFGAAYTAMLLGGNEPVGLLLGLPWGCTASFVAVEILAGLIVGLLAAFGRYTMVTLASRRVRWFHQ